MRNEQKTRHVVERRGWEGGLCSCGLCVVCVWFMCLVRVFGLCAGSLCVVRVCRLCVWSVSVVFCVWCVCVSLIWISFFLTKRSENSNFFWKKKKRAKVRVPPTSNFSKTEDCKTFVDRWLNQPSIAHSFGSLTFNLESFTVGGTNYSCKMKITQVKNEHQI